MSPNTRLIFNAYTQNVFIIWPFFADKIGRHDILIGIYFKDFAKLCQGLLFFYCKCDKLSDFTNSNLQVVWGYFNIHRKYTCL